jgi:GT2 family glycosyltransferase
MDADWLVGAVHAIRSRAITRANVFSERGFMFAEDMELCYFVRQQGWRVRFDPESEIVHVGNATGAREFGAFRESRWLDATYDWYVAEHSEAAARRWALANTVGLTAKAAAFSLMRDQRREYVQGLLKFHARRIVNPSGDLHSRLPPSASAT